MLLWGWGGVGGGSRLSLEGDGSQGIRLPSPSNERLASGNRFGGEGCASKLPALPFEGPGVGEGVGHRVPPTQKSPFCCVCKVGVEMSRLPALNPLPGRAWKPSAVAQAPPPCPSSPPYLLSSLFPQSLPSPSPPSHFPSPLPSPLSFPSPLPSSPSLLHFSPSPPSPPSFLLLPLLLYSPPSSSPSLLALPRLTLGVSGFLLD